MAPRRRERSVPSADRARPAASERKSGRSPVLQEALQSRDSNEAGTCHHRVTNDPKAGHSIQDHPSRVRVRHRGSLPATRGHCKRPRLGPLSGQPQPSWVVPVRLSEGLLRTAPCSARRVRRVRRRAACGAAGCSPSLAVEDAPRRQLPRQGAGRPRAASDIDSLSVRHVQSPVRTSACPAVGTVRPGCCAAPAFLSPAACDGSWRLRCARLCTAAHVRRRVAAKFWSRLTKLSVPWFLMPWSRFSAAIAATAAFSRRSTHAEACTPTVRRTAAQKLFGLRISSARTIWIARGRFGLPRTGVARPA